MSDFCKPDLGKKLYTIVIDVHPNINVFRIEDASDKDAVTTQHIVGALEIVKMAYLRAMNDEVKKAWNAHETKAPTPNTDTP